MPVSYLPSLSINIPVKRINKILLGVIIINVILLFGTWLHASNLILPRSYSLQILLVQFNLAKENVAAAWYSSMLLFVVGLMAAGCFIKDMQRFSQPQDRILSFGWIIVSMIFILLSFDEMGSFHEMIGETALFKKAGNNNGGGWYVFYALIGLVAIFMIAFFLVKFKNNKKAFLLTTLAVLLFISNPFQEKYEIQSWRNSPNPDLWHRPVFFLLLEEGSEIFASFCFLYSFVLYSIGASKKDNDLQTGKGLNISLKLKSNTVFYFLGLMGLLGALMLLVRFNAWHIAGDDNGIPQNWFPSMMSFLAFLFSICLYFLNNEETVSRKAAFLSLAFLSLFTSVFFGSNIYGYWFSIITKIPYLLLLLTVLIGGFAIIKLAGNPVRIALAVWILFMALSVFSKEFLPAAFGYIAASFLVLSLFLYYQNSKQLLRSNDV